MNRYGPALRPPPRALLNDLVNPLYYPQMPFGSPYPPMGTEQVSDTPVYPQVPFAAPYPPAVTEPVPDNLVQTPYGAAFASPAEAVSSVTETSLYKPQTPHVLPAQCSPMEHPTFEKKTPLVVDDYTKTLTAFECCQCLCCCLELLCGRTSRTFDAQGNPDGFMNNGLIALCAPDLCGDILTSCCS